MEKLRIQYVALDSLKLNPKNPNTHPDKEISALVKSIEKNGWTNPILVDRDGYVVAGHARYEAAEIMGQKDVPTIVLNMDGNDSLAYMLLDNKIQEYSEWDLSALKDLLSDISMDGYDLELTGFTDGELDAFIYGINLDEEVGAMGRKQKLGKQGKGHHLDSDKENSSETVRCQKCGFEFYV